LEAGLWRSQCVPQPLSRNWGLLLKRGRERRKVGDLHIGEEEERGLLLRGEGGKEGREEKGNGKGGESR